MNILPNHALLRVDNTDDYSPGMVVPVFGVDYMVMWILNENDLSVIKHEPKVLH